MSLHMDRRTRLQFERELVKQPTDGDSNRHASMRGLYLSAVGLAVFLGAGIALVVAAVIPRVWGQSEDAALKSMLATFAQKLQEGDLDGALGAWIEENGAADSPPNPLSSQTLQTDPNNRLETLAELRSDLEAYGLDWSETRPAAFVGLSADVCDPREMPAPVRVVLGNLYLISKGKLFSVELSARKVQDRYFLVELWQWGLLEAHLDSLTDAGVSHLLKFDREMGAADLHDPINRLGQIYLAFEDVF